MTTFWRELNPSSFWITQLPINDIKLTDNASSIYIVTDAGIQYSGNGGTSWTMLSTIDHENIPTKKISVSADGTYILCGAYDPGFGTNVQISSNGGINWTILTSVIPEINGYIVGISGNNTFAGVGYQIGTNCNIATSFDSGVSWSSIGNTSRGFNSEIISYNISYDGQYHVAGGNSNTLGFLLQSTDYGSNFTELTSYVATTTLRFMTMSQDGAYLIIGDNSNWLLSRDYGSNWENIPITTNFGYFWASLSSNGEYGIIGNYYHHYTSDYGSNWTSNYSFNDYANVLSYNGQIRYWGYDADIFKSTDYDTNWSTIRNPLSQGFSGVGNDMSSNGTYQLATNGGTYWISTDNGDSWIDSGNNANSICCDFLGIIQYKTFGTNIEKSTDYGSNWNIIINDAIDAQLVRCSHDGCNVIFYDNTTSNVPLFLSSDGGSNFSYYSSAVTSGILTQELSKNGSTIVRSYESSLLYLLEISHDFGQTWTYNSSAQILFVNTIALSFNGQKIVFSSANGTFFSTDGGNNFNEVLLNGLTQPYMPPTISYDGNISFFASSTNIPTNMNIIYRSDNDGSNLQKVFGTSTRNNAFSELNTPRSSWNGDYIFLTGNFTSIFQGYFVPGSFTSFFIRPDANPNLLKYFFTPGTLASSVRLTVAGCNYDFPSNSNEIQYDVGGLTNNVKYSTFLTSYINDGSDIYDILNFRTVEPGYLPAAPESVAAASAGGTKVNISWAPPLSNGDATINWYVIKNNITNIRYSAPGETSNRIIDVGSAGTYTFDVYAVNDPGYSVPSTTAAIVIPAAAP